MPVGTYLVHEASAAGHTISVLVLGSVLQRGLGIGKGQLNNALHHTS